jgi:hypothetical protein
MYQRQITTREQLLNEMLRVKLTQGALKTNQIDKEDKEGLFLLMKDTTEDTLSFFPADREDFFALYTALESVDLITFALTLYREDRSGMIVSPRYLTTYIGETINGIKPQTILITEAEKHLAGLKELIERFKESQITLTTQHHLMFLLLKTAFQDEKHVSVVFESIYSDCLETKKYDYIYAFPAFGKKIDFSDIPFSSKESEGIALENLLRHLNQGGCLDIIIPSSLTFTSRTESLRAHIQEHYHLNGIYILPERTFSPSTAVKTYLLNITDTEAEGVKIGTFTLEKDNFKPKGIKHIPTATFKAQKDWRIELLLSDDDETIRQFKQSTVKKVQLKDIAEVFRGKSILKKDVAPGPIAVLNLSNIINGEIDTSELATINEEERKIKRYELEDGDVLLSCRGTAIKSAVYQKETRIVIASANLIVIRPKGAFIGGYIKLFLESPVGIAMIKSFQRGTSVMNLNHSDIMEMEIPTLPLEKQREMVELYRTEREAYKGKIQQAENTWNNVKERLYSQLIKEKDG